jgi:hypothetical protein
MKAAILYVLVGDRDINHLNESIASVRKYRNDIDIIVLSDIDYVKIAHENITLHKFTRRKHDKREENRNSSEWRLRGLLGLCDTYDCICYLDNDVYIVDKGFFSGFEIAQKYGLCMPFNPRNFFKSENQKGDLEIGADVHLFDIENTRELPKYTTALNMGVMFYNCHDVMAKRFLTLVLGEQLKEQSRGQAALARSLQKTSYHPYTLAQQFLACREIDYPLAIHAGNPKMYEMWKGRK